MTFSLDHDVDAIPGYQHDDPAQSFPPLFDLIAGLLEASLPSRVIALDMSRPDGQTWKASLHDMRLREDADFYLSVRSDVPAWQIAERFPTLCKAGSPDNVNAISSIALDGIPLIAVNRVPAALPVRLENQYFALDMECAASHEMLDQGVCLFYIPALLGELELELFAVLRS
jgi:type VI secretion system protein ImpJ